jgi:hypothetical protein
MSSYRTQIKQAIKTQLTGETVAGANVLTSLDRPLNPEHDLPAIIVYTMAARRGSQDYGNSLIPRTVTIAIEGAVSASPQSALSAAEALVDQIETAMEADPTLGQLVTDTKWRQSISDVSSHGSTTMGVCIVEYDVDMMTNLKPDGAYEQPAIPLDELPEEVIISPNQTPVAYVDLPVGTELTDEVLAIIGEGMKLAGKLETLWKDNADHAAIVYEVLRWAFNNNSLSSFICSSVIILLANCNSCFKSIIM